MQTAIWRALLLALSPAPDSPVRKSGASTPLFATFEPLVGGPQWLPLHVVVEVDGEAFDFLPLEPTAPSTALSLASGGAAPGLVRCRTSLRRPSSTRSVAIGSTTKTAAALLQHARSHDTGLRLLQNDCWTFAASLRDFACAEEDGAAVGGPLETSCRENCPDRR